MKLDLKKYVRVAVCPSPTTLGTFGIAFEIHWSPSDYENLPLMTTFDKGSSSISFGARAGILSCKFSGFKGISSMAAIG